MAEANEAYERGDEAQLAKILTEYEHSPEAVKGEGPGAELVRVIRRISQARSRLSEIEAELQQLLRSDLYQLKSRLDEAQKTRPRRAERDDRQSGRTDCPGSQAPGWHRTDRPLTQ